MGSNPTVSSIKSESEATTRFFSGTTNWRRLLALVAAVYVVFALAIFFGAERLIFIPHDPGYPPGPGILMIPTVDHESIAAISHQITDAPFTVIYFHGNEEDLSDVGDRLAEFKQLGLSTFAIDYRGYGRSAGTPTEENTYHDADAAYSYVTNGLKVPPTKIIVLGRSLGGAVAIDLAARRPVAGLVIESSFTSAYRVAVPFPILPFDQFESIDKIDRVKCPIAVMHGTADDVVPFSQGKELFAAAHQPKISLWVDGATHATLLARAGHSYADTIRSLLDMIAAQRR